MIENTNFEPQVKEMLTTPTKISVILLVNLHCKTIVLTYYYILNLVYKKFANLLSLSS